MFVCVANKLLNIFRFNETVLLFFSSKHIYIATLQPLGRQWVVQTLFCTRYGSTVIWGKIAGLLKHNQTTEPFFSWYLAGVCSQAPKIIQLSLLLLRPDGQPQPQGEKGGGASLAGKTHCPVQQVWWHVINRQHGHSPLPDKKTL